MRAAFLFLALFSSVSIAQDIAPIASPNPVFGLHGVPLIVAPPEPRDAGGALRAVVEPVCRVSKRVVLVIDVSGSMKGDLLARAMSAARELIETPEDDLELAIIAFAGETDRWPGVPEPDDRHPVPHGWARFPSLDAAASARRWLSGFSGDGGTNVAPAITEALAEPRDDMTVILVTDGIFDGSNDRAIAAFRDGQRGRQEAGRRPALFVVYGVGPAADKKAHLSHMGREGGGGFFVDSLRAAPLPPAVKRTYH